MRKLFFILAIILLGTTAYAADPTGTVLSESFGDQVSASNCWSGDTSGSCNQTWLMSQTPTPEILPCPAGGPGGNCVRFINEVDGAPHLYFQHEDTNNPITDFAFYIAGAGTGEQGIPHNAHGVLFINSDDNHSNFAAVLALTCTNVGSYCNNDGGILKVYAYANAYLNKTADYTISIGTWYYVRLTVIRATSTTFEIGTSPSNLTTVGTIIPLDYKVGRVSVEAWGRISGNVTELDIYYPYVAISLVKGHATLGSGSPSTIGPGGTITLGP